MKHIDTYISEKLVINKSSMTKDPGYNYYPKDDELDNLIQKLIKERGYDADLNDIDTSNITDMSSLFINSAFNGDISSWDVSNVIDMQDMFYDCPLENNLPTWYEK